ncbi:ROK family protein [Leifsonia shinshuensis]|uniref:ROK family protein n=1 Tax=Leifsonia shinshuensis TaxID=150026 RepID=A0A7G6Y901_9MICO|nr:ROK family protein [Leifsonia shinshuensis]QNE34966.1 ROK family protein [Leifsonia shinshuensis]
MDHSEMRQRNAASTLGILYRTGPAKMTELQQESGLSRRTIELILDDLMDTGWVVELAAASPDARPVGRPARSFAFRYDAACVVALQLEAGQIHATVADLATTILGDLRVPLPIKTSRAERLSLLDDCVTRLLDDAGVDRSAVVAVTVSTPGIVRDDGMVDLPMTMPEWTGFSLRDAVGELFDCPVRVENDAKVAALGEKWSRDGEVQDFAYIFSDSERIGIGLVLRNELYRGRDGAAGEVSWARDLGLHDLVSPLLVDLDDELAPGHAATWELVTAARAGERHALEEVDRLANALSTGVTLIAWLLAPEEIILGGSLGTLQDLLIPALERRLATNDRPIETRLRGSQFGDASVLTGALRMCIESLADQLFTPAGVATIGRARIPAASPEEAAS